jgi:hypothetical protein
VSTSQFHLFAAALNKRFAEMSKHELFVVDVDGQAVWDAYLAAFPEGTNPIFRVRTEHDGSYDRNVVRKIGNVVYIDKSGHAQSVWNLDGLPHPYDVVAAQLNTLVQGAKIVSLFRWKERKLGYVSTVEEYERRARPASGSISTPTSPTSTSPRRRPRRRAPPSSRCTSIAAASKS